MTNPLFDGTLVVKVGTLDVTSAIIPGSITGISTTMPGGFGETGFSLPATSPWGAYNAQVVRGATVTITHGSTPTTLFEGKITNDVSHAVIRGGVAQYEVAAAGLWYWASVRQDFARGYVDSDFTQWQPYKWSVSKYESSADGSLYMGLGKGEAMSANRKCGFYYWLHNGLSESADEYIDHIELMHTCDLGAAWYSDWRYGTSHPWDTAAMTLSLRLNNVTRSTAIPLRIPNTGSFPSTTKSVRVDFYPNADVTALSRDLFVDYRKIRVYIGSNTRRHESTISTLATGSPATITTTAAHGLKTGDSVFIWLISGETPNVYGYYEVTVTGTTTFTIPVNVTVAGTGGTVCGPLRVEEIMADAATLTGLASSASVSALTAAAPNGQKLAMARPFGTVAQFIDDTSAPCSLPIKYGFWGSGVFEAGPCTYSTVTAWQTNASTVPGTDYDVFRDSEWAYDYVRILYKFRDAEGGTSTLPDGTPKTHYAYKLWDVATGAFIAASPTDPGWTDMGKRVYLYDASEYTYEDAQARQVGEQLLAYIAANAYRGSIVITAPTTSRSGLGSQNTAYIRAGDWIKEENHGVPLYISGTDIDVDTGAVTLTIGHEAREFVAGGRQQGVFGRYPIRPLSTLATP